MSDLNNNNTYKLFSNRLLSSVNLQNVYKSVLLYNADNRKRTRTNNCDIIFCYRTKFDSRMHNCTENMDDYQDLLSAQNTHTEHQDSQFLDKLVSESSNWSLPIEKINFHENNELHVFLNRKKCFKSVIECTLISGANYGKCEKMNKTVLVTSENVSENYCDLNVSELRNLLFKKLLINLLESYGYDVSEKEVDQETYVTHVHLSEKSRGCNMSPSCHQIVTGIVLTDQEEHRKVTMSALDYLKQRIIDMQRNARHKYGDCVISDDKWKNFLEKLGHAAVVMDLVYVKPKSVVYIDTTPDACENRNKSTKGAPFVLYNCARLATLFRIFEEKVSEGCYPPLIPLEEVDFSLLTKQEEWKLLLCILQFPNTIEECVGKIEKGLVLPHIICHFILHLSHIFSSYYRQTQILTEGRSHLLPVMFARIYLLKAVEQVIHNCLALLHITPVSQM